MKKVTNLAILKLLTFLQRIPKDDGKVSHKMREVIW